MNSRAFRALIVREVRRGKRTIILAVCVAAVSVLLALTMSEGIAFLPATASVVIGVALVFAPLGDLRSDKTLGHLEFDRVLPIGHRAIALARLIGAAVRTAPTMLLAIPIVILIDRDHALTALRVFFGIAIPVVIWLFLTAFVWMMMAVNARWNLRRLWWLPMTIAFGPQVIVRALPPSVKEAIAAYGRSVAGPLGAFFASPPGIILALAFVLAIPASFLWFAISIFASGLARYSFDASGAVSVLGAPPTRELSAVGRGPVFAVARYCIRLATEQSKRRLILLGVIVVVLVIGSPELKNYAKFYVRALSALIPGGIALHLAASRQRGDLEGMQQLPHPGLTIAFGYLLGIAVLATPGAAVWVFARAVTGTPATIGNALSLLLWMIGWSWVAAASVMWLTSRRLLLIGSVPLLAVAAWVASVGVAQVLPRGRDAIEAFRLFREQAGVLYPAVLATIMIVGGLPLFARGLEEFELAGAKKPSRWAAAIARIDERRSRR